MPRSEMPGTPLEVPVTEGTLDRALALVRLLRVHCPWDAAQTANTLVPHLIEEPRQVTLVRPSPATLEQLAESPARERGAWAAGPSAHGHGALVPEQDMAGPPLALCA